MSEENVLRQGRVARCCAAVGLVALVVGSAVAVSSGSTSADAGAAPAGNVALASDTVADASAPSISGDGRWVVFGGTDGGRRTVFRTDRETGATVELSPLPRDVDEGDTIHARLSADGCVVVALTEIPVRSLPRRRPRRAVGRLPARGSRVRRSTQRLGAGLARRAARRVPRRCLHRFAARRSAAPAA